MSLRDFCTKSARKIAFEIVAASVISHHNHALIDFENIDNKQHTFSKFCERIFDKVLQYNGHQYYDEARNNYKKIISDGTIMSLFERSVDEIVNIISKIFNDNTVKSAKYPMPTVMFQLGCVMRLILSILSDADNIDTSNFINGKYKYDYPKNIFVQSQHKLDEYMNQLSCIEPVSNKAKKVIKHRTIIHNNCSSKGNTVHSGIYTLTVPTGFGKTLSSLRFGINNAIKNNYQKILFLYLTTQL